jgi:NAD(P)H-flavin reductase
MKNLSGRLLRKDWIGGEIVQLEFSWAGPPPRGGQFFMIKPKRSGVFLGRPISAARWNPVAATVRFLIARRGRGTEELAEMAPEDEVELTGPLGNAWGDFLPDSGTIALASGGIGVAPLLACAAELAEKARPFDFYAGFKTASLDEQRFRQKPGQTSPAEALVSEAAGKARKTLIATEDGGAGQKGRIPDFFDPAGYGAVYVCGPEPMLRAVAEKCRRAAVPCFVSLERHMACGVGACRGCTVQTAQGNRRCCADGPVFPAEEIYFEH